MNRMSIKSAIGTSGALAAGVAVIVSLGWTSGNPSQAHEANTSRAPVISEKAPTACAQDQAVTRDLRAAESGQAEAQFRVGLSLLTNGSDMPLAAQWFTKAAAQGLADAQFYLGSMHASGVGVPADDREAVALFRRAAEQGHRDSMVTLGAMLIQGRGPDIAVPAFRTTEVERLRAAVGQPVTVSGTVARLERIPTSPGTSKSYNLYIYFAGGEDVRVRAVSPISDRVDERFGRDDLIGKTVAVTVPRLYALTRGPIEIGITRVDEIRVEGSPERPEADLRRARATASRPEAMRWLAKATERGLTRAYTWMGLAYTQEYVESYDYVEAAYWFREAAQRGDDYARVMLADLYVEGRGVRQSPADAHPLYAQAALSPDVFIAERAKKGLKGIEASQPGLGRADWFLIGVAAFFTYAILTSDSGASSVSTSSEVDAARARRNENERILCSARGGYWNGLWCTMPPPPCRTSLGLPC
jgi:TPR repeat protein